MSGFKLMAALWGLRHLGALLLASELEDCGYLIDWENDLARYSQKTSNWNDVQQKGIRLYKDGQVTMLRNSYEQVMGKVIGDHGVYTSWYTRQDPNSAVWTTSGCDCPWNQYRWMRTGPWKKYEGRICFRESTLITMADGTYKPISEVVIGDRVWTHNGIGEVTATMVNPYDGEMVKLHSFGHGKPLVLTPEHPVWGYGTPQRLWKAWQDTKGQSFKYYDESFLYEKEPAWIDAKDIKIYDWLTSPILDNTFGGPLDLLSILPSDWEYIEEGDYIIRTYTQTTQKKNNTSYNSTHKCQGKFPRYIYPSEPLMRLLGLFVAEGYAGVLVKGHPSQIEWSLHRNEKDTLGKVIEDSLRELGIDEKVSYYERGGTQGLSVRVTHHPLAILLHILAGQFAAQKQWHPWVMSLSPSDQATILKYHWEGDGSESQADNRLIINTVSEQLALQTKEMLLRCGKLPTWQMVKQNGGPTNRDKECIIYRVMWVEDPQFTNGQRSDPDHMYVMNKVRKVEREPHKGNVYNISVYPQESYVADGRIVHNCAHLYALGLQSAVTPLDEDVHPATQFGLNPQQSIPGAQMQQTAPPGSAGYDESAAPASDFRILNQNDPWANVQSLPPNQQPSQQPPFISTEPLLIPMQAEDYQKALLDQMQNAPYSQINMNEPLPGSIDNRGTLSSIILVSNGEQFQQGDTVRINVETMAQKEGKEGAIDDGEWITIPRNTQGEVFDVDDATGWVSVLFSIPGARMQVPLPVMATMARSYMEPGTLTLVNRGGLSTPFIKTPRSGPLA